MNKLFLMIMVLMMIATPAMASDVTVNSVLDNPGNTFNLGFNMVGTLGVTTTGITSANPVGSGVTPGTIGQINTFGVTGNAQGTYRTTMSKYGILGTYVNASGDAALQMTDEQNFDGMSGNGSTGVIGTFYAYAAGTNAAMNLKSIGSMYVYSEATNGGIALQGQIIEKTATTSVGGTLLTNLYLGIQTDGTASISNSNAWGWGNYQSGSSTTNYAGGTRSFTSTGAGSFMISGMGTSGFDYNVNAVLPGGGGTLGNGSIGFNNDVTGTYSLTVN